MHLFHAAAFVMMLAPFGAMAAPAEPAGQSLTAPATEPEGCPHDAVRLPEVQHLGLRRLVGTALVQRLAGMRLIYADLSPNIEDAPRYESYAKDGTWILGGGRAEHNARYEVRHTTVRVLGTYIKPDREGVCRSVYIDGSGGLYISMLGETSAHIQPVRVEKLR